MSDDARTTQGARGLDGRRRGFALVIVLFAVGIATGALLLLQGSAFRQAISGREALGQVRAKWAARAGLEANIARLAYNTENPDDVIAFTTVDDMTQVSRGAVLREWRRTGDAVAEWEIRTWDGENLLEGPGDAHSKVNVNRMAVEDLLELDGMTEDVAAAIVDWIDADDLVSEFGAESGFYSRREPSYEPRNAPVRSIEELELVVGVEPELLRGEDWNLNGLLDPNEDDGDASWPPDNSDGVLDAGWSGIITTESIDQGLAFSGVERVYLPEADAGVLTARVRDLTNIQARALIASSGIEDMDLDTFLRSGLPQLAQFTGEFTQIELQQIAPLNADQLRDIFNELTMNDPGLGPAPGKVNINTVRREVLDYVTLFRDNPGQADTVIFIRDNQPSGFVSIIDLLDVTTPQDVANLWRDMDVTTNAYVVTSVGRDLSTGIEVEVRATIDRTRLPIVISEMVIR